MLFQDMTKGQRTRIRELAALAHERELEAELRALEDVFARWHAGELSAFDVSDVIHAFHQGPSRKLFTAYTGPNFDFAVADAFNRKVLSESDLGPEVVSLLSRHLLVNGGADR